MSSRLTLILAAFFLLAALLAGYWGIVLSRPAAVPAPVTPAGEQPVVAVAPPPPLHRSLRTAVVVLRKATASSTPITEDVLIERLQAAPGYLLNRRDQANQQAAHDLQRMSPGLSQPARG